VANLRRCAAGAITAEITMKVGDDVALVEATRLSRHSTPVLVDSRFRACAQRRDLLVVCSFEIKPQDPLLVIAQAAIGNIRSQDRFEMIPPLLARRPRKFVCRTSHAVTAFFDDYAAQTFITKCRYCQKLEASRCRLCDRFFSSAALKMHRVSWSFLMCVANNSSPLKSPWYKTICPQ
jgi:hypothetical protein